MPEDEKATALIPMHRAEPMKPGGATTANIHPSNVAACRAQGWMITPEEGAPDPNAPVEIPDDWRTLHHAKKTKLARDIQPGFDGDSVAAVVVIDEEITRRAAAETAPE